MTKHFSHDESNVGVEEDERKQERSLRPVTAGWTRFVNGRQYCHFLDVARKPPRRSYIGLPIADPLSRLAFIWGTIATMTDMTYTAFVVPLSLAFCDYGEFGAYWVSAGGRCYRGAGEVCRCDTPQHAALTPPPSPSPPRSWTTLAPRSTSWT